jgi:hypothetical protein
MNNGAQNHHWYCACGIHYRRPRVPEIQEKEIRNLSTGRHLKYGAAHRIKEAI